jgi:hypothetical protein
VDLQQPATVAQTVGEMPGGAGPSPAQPLERSRRQRLVLPLALGATAVCGCAAIALADPGDDGVPLCWSRSVFGVDCPFCGGLRCTNALLRGHVGQALDHNVVLAVALPVAAMMWVWWVLRSWRNEPAPVSKVPDWLAVSAALLLLVFGVVRNLSGTALARWLHSDLFAG